MATSKRDRQRANREEKQRAQAKVDRRQKIFHRGRRIALWALLVAAVLVVANLFFGSSDDGTTTTTTTPPTTQATTTTGG